jgi:hypothetical protein
MNEDQELIARLFVNYYEQRSGNERRQIVAWLRAQADFLENDKLILRNEPLSHKYVAKLSW